MAGVPGGLGIPTKEERIRSFLQEAAVGDASHDFSGTRSGGDVFNKIYKGQGGNPPFKAIGTPSLVPDSESPMHEFDILNLFLEFQDPKKSLIESFRETFLKDGQTVRTFFRWSEDQNTPYTVTARKVATRPQRDDEGSREYNWLLTPHQLYDFMAGANPSLAFTIDAANVPFYDRLVQKTGAAVQKIGTYVYMRESVNDAASKVNISNIDDADVRIQTVEDKATYNVLYPSMKDTTPAALAALSEQEMFYSDYNVSLSGMGSENPPAVTLTLYNNAFTQKVQIVKGRKEEAHPNAVPTLAKRIVDLAKSLKPGGEEKKKMEYFTALQQKRSGDWLQVLGCLQPERFGLPPSSRIALISLDKICVAYGLFAGVDVIMTYFLEGRDGADNSYWMIRFQRDFNLPPKSKKDQIRDAILAYPDPASFATQFPEMTFEKSADCPDLGPTKATSPYAKAKEQYICQWNNANRALLLQLNKSIKELSDYVESFREVPRFSAIEINLQNHVKKVLTQAGLLALFRSIALPLDMGAGDESAIYAELANPATWNNAAYTPSEQEFANIQYAFSVYKKNYGMLRNVLHAKKDRARSMQEAYQLYFEAIVLKNTALEGLIQKLALFGSLFRKENGGANGMGIFSFLTPHLTSSEAKQIQMVFQKCDGIISDKSKKAQFGTFAETAALLLGQYTNKMEITIPASELMVSIHAHYDAPSAGGSYPIQKGGDADLDILQVSDFSAAMAILSKRFNGMRSKKGNQLFNQINSMIQKGGGTVSSSKKPLGSTRRIASRAFLQPHRRSATRSARMSAIQSVTQSIHNPFVTFYFLLRELSYRLSLSDEEVDPKDKSFCVVLSRILINVLGNVELFEKIYAGYKKPQSSAAMRMQFEYLYYTSIESYLLDISMFDTILSVPRSFMKDLVNSYLQGYFVAPLIDPKQAKNILSRGELTDIFTPVGPFKSKKSQISENLYAMQVLIEKIKQMDISLIFILQNLKGASSSSKPLYRSVVPYSMAAAPKPNKSASFRTPNAPVAPKPNESALFGTPNANNAPMVAPVPVRVTKRSAKPASGKSKSTARASRLAFHPVSASKMPKGFQPRMSRAQQLRAVAEGNENENYE